MTLPTAQQVADQFIEELTDQLSADELDAIRNDEKEPDDYLDSNMVMDAALEALGVTIWTDDGDHMREDVCDLWNEAVGLVNVGLWRWIDA